MAKASDKATKDRTGSATVGLGVVAILLMFLANIFSINDALTNDGVPSNNPDGQFFWAAVFTIASMFAPIFAFTTGKSFQKRPSVHIMLFIEFISFGLWAFPYFRDLDVHFITGGASLVVALLAPSAKFLLLSTYFALQKSNHAHGIKRNVCHPLLLTIR